MALNTYLEIRDEMQSAKDDKGWTQARIETRITRADNRVIARLAKAYPVDTLTAWAADAATAPPTLKEAGLYLTCSYITGGAKRYRKATGDEGEPVGYGVLFQALIKAIETGKQPIIDNAGEVHTPGSKVKIGDRADAGRDSSVLGGLEGRHPYLAERDDET